MGGWIRNERAKKGRIRSKVLVVFGVKMEWQDTRDGGTNGGRTESAVLGVEKETGEGRDGCKEYKQTAEVGDEGE